MAVQRIWKQHNLKPHLVKTFKISRDKHFVEKLYDVPDGKVIGDCMPRHRHQEFIRFLTTIDVETPSELDLHVIVDNYATHKHPRVKSWLRRHPRFHLHFIPTSSSWLNLVERWFREITGHEERVRLAQKREVPLAGPVDQTEGPAFVPGRDPRPSSARAAPSRHRASCLRSVASPRPPLDAAPGRPAVKQPPPERDELRGDPRGFEPRP
jgi:transposase